MRKIRKTLFTLDINHYEPEITALTYPLMEYYAKKIGADFHIIKDRKFPDYPLTYEKLQLYNIIEEEDIDWAVFVDADTIIKPDFFDITIQFPKDTVCHNANDESSHRYKADRYFLRDGRFIGSCNWFAVASDWCIDLWHPLDDMTCGEALNNIMPIMEEINTGLIPREHLIDDYVLSRNIARFGLKFTTVRDLQMKKGYAQMLFLYHVYNVPAKQKLEMLTGMLKSWGVVP